MHVCRAHFQALSQELLSSVQQRLPTGTNVRERWQADHDQCQVYLIAGCVAIKRIRAAATAVSLVHARLAYACASSDADCFLESRVSEFGTGMDV